MHVTIESVFRERQSFTKAAKSDQSLTETNARLLVLSVVGLGLYGLGMGSWHSPLQAVSSLVKLPCLFVGSVLVTFPAFHFVGLLAGARTRFDQSLMVFLHGLAITSVLSLAFLPVTVFFALTNSSYDFMLLLHVGLLGFSSIAGAYSIIKNLGALAESGSSDFRERASLCIYGWLLLFAFVGTQLAYTLSPFIGKEDAFYLVSPGEGNFYSATINAIIGLFGG